MINEKELREMRPKIRFKNKQGTTLNILQKDIEQKAEEYEIPVAFYNDKVKYGGLIGGGNDDCLVVHHPNHKDDYFKIAVRIKYQGTYAFVTVEDFGRSKLLGYEMNKSAMKETWNDKSTGDMAMAGAIFKTVRSKIMTTGKRNDLEDEKQWYAIISDIFDEILSATDKD